MSDIVPAGDIEQIVGVTRQDNQHVGRYVSAEERLFILHSGVCKNSGIDLRECGFSVAMDRGIDMDRWAAFQDQPVTLWVSAETDQLIPMHRLAPMPPPTEGLPRDLREAIDQIAKDVDVKMRARGVIALHLCEEFDIEAQVALDSATKLIGKLTDADLDVIVVSELQAFIDGIKARVPVQCKHCDDLIRREEKAGGDYLHLTGLYAGRHNCATKDYGYHAEPVGTECRADGPNPCRGGRE